MGSKVCTPDCVPCQPAFGPKQASLRACVHGDSAEDTSAFLNSGTKHPKNYSARPCKHQGLPWPPGWWWPWPWPGSGTQRCRGGRRSRPPLAAPCIFSTIGKHIPGAVEKAKREENRTASVLPASGPGHAHGARAGWCWLRPGLGLALRGDPGQCQAAGRTWAHPLDLLLTLKEQSQKWARVRRGHILLTLFFFSS